MPDRRGGVPGSALVLMVRPASSCACTSSGSVPRSAAIRRSSLSLFFSRKPSCPFSCLACAHHAGRDEQAGERPHASMSM